MPASTIRIRYNKLAAWSLFILLILWSGTESTNGSGIPGFLKPENASGLKVAEAGEFSVITYNIAGLPAIISSAATERSSSIAEIGLRLNRFDIVHVQEDFNYHENLYAQGNTHAFRTETKGGVPLGDGLNTLSRYPVRDLRRITWNDCTGADCLTPKGFTFSRIEVAKNVFIDFYNIHANAYNDLPAAAARRKNMAQFSEYIKIHSHDNAVIVMGDLNGHYSYFYDNIKLLNTENKLEDVWTSFVHKNRFPPVHKDLPVSNILSINESSETIDKILFRSSRLLEIHVSDYQLQNLLFLNQDGIPLSDHHPVSAQFSWNLKKNTGKEKETSKP
ncbi:endonuclease/exonuclease/phosphatase family protein [Dyadobacter flavalbus]|nr:endonuclease/exonuclease/phosphatase family protein [Dyadobacter flavalbus]